MEAQQTQPSQSPEAEPQAPTARGRRRSDLFAGIAAVVMIAVGGALTVRNRAGVSTDDAFVKADIVTLPAEVGGTVQQVSVKENQHVEVGDLLVLIDDATYRLRLAQANANLATAAADARRAEEAVAAARTQLQLADLQNTEATRQQRLQQRLASGGAAVTESVERATAALRATAQSVVAIVPDHFYVVANFKETDLADIHLGDPVTIELDAYPDEEITGRVDSIGAGTGAAFSLLPADNASGNFVKVVQRVPIRVAIHDQTVHGRPLTVGLSANVTVPRRADSP